MVAPRNWRPGSFTKNFSWGKAGAGLSHLHHAIDVAFSGNPEDVRRDHARAQLRTAGVNDLIPPNFFLANRSNGESYLVADELVAFALNNPPGRDFDLLAAFALNLSLAGKWMGARPEQSYPAEWAKHFVVSQVFDAGRWRPEHLSADEIEAFIRSNPSYSGVWARKAATNLNHIYDLAEVASLRSGLTERWWSSAVFLALDRITIDRGWTKPWPTEALAQQALIQEHVFELTAVPISEGSIAAREIAALYFELGGLARAKDDTRLTEEDKSKTTDETGLARDARPVERIYALTSRQVRDRRIVEKVRRIYEDKCCVCGLALPMGGDTTYSEIGHVKPIGLPIKGPDHISNTLPFCPNHHKQFDRGSIYFEVKGKLASVVDVNSPSTVHGRTFRPSPDHSFEMSNLRWHADFFLQR